MYSLDEYKNRNPREPGRNHREYNEETYRNWRRDCLNDARRYLHEGQLPDCIEQLLQVLEEENV